MAKIKIKTDADRDLTTIILYGKVNADAIMSAMQAFYVSAVTSKTLWDFSDCDVTGLMSDDLARIVAYAKNFAHSRPDGKSAIVGPNDLAYGLGRMYSTLSEMDAHPVVSKIFRTVEAAVAWLGSDECT